ncbi:MAG: monofunctional biosynthetic peptidoglycan transglycosylase [Flavobacteriales bacterium]|jgi:monofunctional biosynthetic peptidoglycan transglycosylase|nr:monofunctional biosynthetic peptidoglycan transglycosylase [Flavobacteriales bacterium]
MIRAAFRIFFAFVCWSVLISASWVALLGAVNPPITWVMVEQSREQEGFHRRNVRLEEMARAMPLAVISSEDQRFMTHGGFSTEQIKRSLGMKQPGFSWSEFLESLWKKKPGKRVKGASTISQQTAKNVFLWPGRSKLRKVLEAWFTVLIEALWTKERILEVYLNVAEMGKGVFGAEAAAQHCFGTTSKKLTPAQAALITTTLPAPRRFNCNGPSGYLLNRQQWVLRQMRNVGDVLDPEVLARRKAKIEAEERKAEERAARRKKK